MKTSPKKLKIAVFAFLTILLIMGISGSVSTVKAQTSATVTVLQAIGGSTSPDTGTYTYAAGQAQTFTATPDTGYVFGYWLLSNTTTVGTLVYSEASVSLTFTAGVTYSLQPYFIYINVAYPEVIPAPIANEAIVIVLAGVGGTTSPGPGEYALVNASSLELTATPLSGWVFDHWVIGGYPLSHGAYSFTDTPTNNPYDVNHGYGYTYSYQPVFSLVSSASPTPTIPEIPSSAVIGIVVALVALLIGAGVYAYGKRK